MSAPIAKVIALLTALSAFLLPCRAAGERSQEGSGAVPLTANRPVLLDPGFRNGVRVIAPTNAEVVQGVLRPPGTTNPPAWRLAQWSSRTTVAGVEGVAVSGGGIRFSSATKSIGFGPAVGNDRGVSLRMLGGLEYEGRLREPQEPWPHLLVEQAFEVPPSLASLKGLRFHIECRLVTCRTNVPVPLQPWHCAQFQAFLTIQNMDRGSAGFGDFLWFGIPVFDSRYRQPVAHRARDTAGSDKYIYTPAGRVYTEASAIDGAWMAIDRDLLPLIREGLDQAWADGFLARSRRLEAFRVTSLNLGWELTGPLEVDMHFRDLGLWAEEGPR